jgi:hypothetical protein
LRHRIRILGLQLQHCYRLHMCKHRALSSNPSLTKKAKAKQITDVSPLLSFFFSVLGLELRGYTLSHSTSPLCEGFFWDRVLQSICPVWLWIMTLVISTSWVARITGVRHWHPVLSLLLTRTVFSFAKWSSKYYDRLLWKWNHITHWYTTKCYSIRDVINWTVDDLDEDEAS